MSVYFKKEKGKQIVAQLHSHPWASAGSIFVQAQLITFIAAFGSRDCDADGGEGFLLLSSPFQPRVTGSIRREKSVLGTTARIIYDPHSLNMTQAIKSDVFCTTVMLRTVFGRSKDGSDRQESV